MVAKRKPFCYALRSSHNFTVLTVGLGMLCDLFLYALVVPIIPSLLSSRGELPQSKLQGATSLLLTAYALSAVLLSPPAGWIADRFAAHRSTPFLAGLALLAVGTALLLLGGTLGTNDSSSNIGGSLPALVCARVLQGASTAVVWTVGLAMLLDTVGAARMGVTMGNIFAVTGGAQLAAPVLGGWLFERAGSGAVAAVALTAIAVDFIMRVSVIEKSNEEREAEEREQEQQRQQQHSDSSSAEAQDTDPLLDSSPTKAPHHQQKRKHYPLPDPLPRWSKSLPTILLVVRDPRLLSAQLLAFAQSTQLSALDATVPTEARAALGFASGATGLLFLPLVVPFIFLNPVFGRAVDRWGPKPPALVALAVQVPILLALRLPGELWPQGGAPRVALWAVLLALNGSAVAGIGSGSIVAAGKVAEGYFSENPEAFGGRPPFAQLFAVNSIVFNCGLAFGPVIAGSLRNAIGYGNMNAVLAGLSAVAGLVCWVYLDGRPAFGKGYEATVEDEVVENGTENE